MRIAINRPIGLAIVGALLASTLVGGAVAVGGRPGVIGALGAVLALVAVSARSARVAATRFSFLVGLFGVFLISANGMRRGALTYSDVLVVVASVPASILALVRGVRVPWWLPTGTALLATSLLLTELFPPSERPASLFLAVNLGTGTADTSSGTALGLRLIVACSLIPLVLGLVANTVHRARTLVTAWLAGVGASCAVGVLAAFTSFDFQQSLTGRAFAIGEYRDAAGRYAGLAVHPTLFGVAAALALPVALARIVDSRSAARWAPLVGLYVLAALLSGSRAAVAGVVVGCVLVLASYGRGRRYVLMVLVLGGLAVTYQGAAVTSSFSSIQRFLGGAGIAGQSAGISDASRAETLANGASVFLDRPLTGYGYEAIRGAHNTWLQLASSGGVFALVGWGLIVFGALAIGLRLRRVLPAAESRDALGLCIALCVFLVAGLSMNAVLDRFLYGPVGLLLAYWLALRASQRQIEGATPMGSDSVSGRRRPHHANQVLRDDVFA